MPGPYSAGSIFLQVVPSFKGVPEKIAAEARVWGASAGKEFDKGFESEVAKGIPGAITKASKATQGEARNAGGNAGKDFGDSFTEKVKYAVARANKEIGAIRIDGDDTALLRAVDRATQRIKTLTTGRNDVGVELDDTELYVQLHALEADLKNLSGNVVTIQAKANTAAALAEVRAAMSEINALADQPVNIQVDADTSAAEAQLGAIGAEADHLDGDTVKIEVNVDGAATAVGELAAVEEAEHRAAASSTNAGNAFRAFSGIVLGIAALGPAVIPVLVGIAGALAAAGPLGAVGLAGIGTAALGLSGIGTAVKALGAQQKSAANDADTYAKSVRTSLNSVVSAQESLDNARAQAAQQAQSSTRAVAQADQGVINAERSLQAAQRSAQQAQEDLTQARKDAIKAERDLQFQIEGGAIAQQQAILDVKDAQAELDRVKADPTSTPEQIQRATLALQQQQLQVKELTAQNSDLADKQQQWVTGGVEGSDQVVAAQQKVQSANQSVADAQASLAQAQGAADQARSAAATQALQSQQAITDAQRQLTQAQANYTDALDKTSASQRNVNAAMAALGPAGQEFARYIAGLTPFLAQMRQAAAEGFLPGLENWFKVITGTYGPQLLGLLSAISSGLGGMFNQFAVALTGPQFQALFAMIQRDAGPFLQIMGLILVNLGNGVASLVTALEPLGFLFGDWLVQATAAFARWAAALPNSTGFQLFLEAVRRDGPLVAKFLLALVDALVAIGAALLPYGETLLRLLTGILDWIAGMDPAKLQAIAVGIVALFLAFQAIVGLQSLLSGLATAGETLAAAFTLMTGAAEGTAAVLLGIAGTVGIILVAIALLGVGFYEAYNHVKWFRDFVNAAWVGIQQATQAVVSWFLGTALPALQQFWNGLVSAAQYAWNQILYPIFSLLLKIFTDVVNGIVWAWNNIGAPLFAYIGQVISDVWNNGIYPILQIWGQTFEWLWTRYIGPAWTNVGKPVFDAILAVVSFLWDYVLKPIFIAIGFAWQVMVTAMAWAWNNILSPVFSVIMAIAQVLLKILVVVVFGAIELAWRLMIGAMVDAYTYVLKPMWDGLSIAAQWLWNNVLKPIFGWIGDAWNGLMTGMRWVYDNVIHPMWKIFEDAMKHVADFFGITRDGIRKVWNEIMAIVAWPINFVIGVIFNKGLFVAWNWIVEHLGLDTSWKAGPWPQITGPGITTFANGGEVPAFANGGRIPGPYLGPKADNVLAMSGGQPIRVNPHEWIQPVDSVDYYGPGFMTAIQKRQIPREMLPGFAGGGQTWTQLDEIRKKNWPGSILTSGYRPGDPGYHGAGEAIDIGWSGNDQAHLMPIAAALAAAYPQSTELIHNPNGSIKNGKAVPPSFWGAATWAQHLSHVHWAMTPEALAGGAQGGGTNLLSGLVDWAGNAWNSVTDVFNSFKDSIKDVAQMGAKFGNSPIVQGIEHAPGHLLDMMWGKAEAKIKEFFANLVSSVNPANGTYDVQTTGPIQDQVKSAFHAYHPGWESGAEWAGVDYVVSHESGWNPKAKNPSSTASGLFQFINGTWAAYRPDNATQYSRAMDAPVSAQAWAGANYMDSRYGDPIGAMNYWKAHHNYAGGGQVIPQLMDMGGWIQPGLNVILNKTRRPEPVINPGTLESLQTIAAGGGSQSMVRDINLPIMPQATPEKIAGEIMHSLTVARRGGKY